ncbi:hypothetical protein LLG95_16870 [bacterium]|nr:hypothetical protein [bacterium]
MADSVLKVHRILREHPIATAGWLAEKTTLTPAPINKALSHLQKIGIVRELTQRKRNRMFSYSTYIEILNKETEGPKLR